MMRKTGKTIRVTLDDRETERDLSKYLTPDLDSTPTLDAPLSKLKSQYQVIERFAEGGTATVSVARDKNLRRYVAVKTLKPEAESNAKTVAAFVSEAKVVAQLDHPAILPVYGLAGDDGDTMHLCMKLVAGRSLREYLREVISQYKDDETEAAAIRNRLEIFLKVCEAIQYAHDRKILHCDLKPENIVIGEYGEVYVVDWGLARKIPDDGNCIENATINGTPRYFAPETLRDGRYCVTSEVFTLGLILQEIVTLRTAVEDRLQPIAECTPSPVKHLFDFRIDRALEAIIRKAEDKDPANRYPGVAELADDLRRYLAGSAVSALPEDAFSRFVRWTSRRRRECAAAFLAALCLLCAVVALSIFGQLRTARQAHTEARMIDYLSDRTATTAARLDLTALQIQEQLLALARISAYLIEHNSPEADAWRKAFRPSLTEIGQSEKGMIYSPYYQRLTAMDYGNYSFAPDADRERCFDFMRKTSPVLRKMRNIVLGSQTGYNFDPKDYDKLTMAYLYRGFPVRSVFIGTEDGLKLLYPWRGNFARAIDPRKRQWYIAAKDRRAPVWGKPYMDFDSISGLSIPCSVPIIDFQDRFVGVAGLDLSVNKLTERVLWQGNVGKYVVEKAVVNRRGETVFSSRSEYFNKKFDPEQYHHDADFKTPLFATTAVRDRILKSGRDFGTFIIEEDGRKLLYSFAVLEVWGMYYVTVADYETLMKNFCMGN